MKISTRKRILLLFILSPLITFGQIITTIAGDSAQGYNGDNIAATAAKIYSPYAIAIDASGNVYFSDQGNYRVRMINTSGVISTIAGNGISGFSGDGGAATQAELKDPEGVAVDASGNLYIADNDDNRIRMVNTSGIITTVVGTGIGSYNGDGQAATLAQINSPIGVAIDALGDIFIADAANGRIRKVDTSGIISTVAGNGTVTGLYNGDGLVATTTSLVSPFGVAVDDSGNIYIADIYVCRILKVNTSGILSTIAGNGNIGYSGDGGAATAAKIWNPTGVAVDGFGNVYIADNYNDRIRKVNRYNIISTFAGDSNVGYFGDGGLAILAELDRPIGVAVDFANNIYIADANNNRVRKVSSAEGINELSTSNNVNVYPNPSNGIFTIYLQSLVGKPQVEVYNMLGEKIYSETLRQSQGNNEINLSNQPSGIYLYRIITENGALISSGKLMIEL